MRTGIRITVTVVLALACAWVGGGGLAHAGGSTWNLDRESYEPGDVATGWASLSWAHNPDLGTPEDGPYFAYVVPADAGSGLGFGGTATVPVAAQRVAEIRVHLEPYDAGGVKFGPHHATVEFTVPDLAPGMYELSHCNDPCTTTLADLTWGFFWIGPVGEVPRSPDPLPPVTGECPTPPSTSGTAPASTTIPPSTTTGGEAPSPTPAGARMPMIARGVGLAAAGGTTALLVRKRR